MGRRKVIECEAVLDAAQKVVSREGAANFTLEAVAAEAGISKASVLYNYKNKKALIRAVIERRIEIESARTDKIVESFRPEADAEIRGRIAAAFRSVSDEDRAVASKLAAALAQDADFREPIREAYAKVLGEITASAREPRGAVLAFLAAEGFKLMDWLGFYSWPAEDWERLRADLLWLSRQAPSELAPSEQAPPEQASPEDAGPPTST